MSRLAAEWRRKVAVCLGLAVGICVPYFGIQRLALLPARTLPETALDRWIAFEPAWIHPYQSIALLVPLAVLLATRREELACYARGLALLCAVSFACFLLLPVAGPRPELLPEGGAYRAIAELDRPSNSLPSLHAGLSLYSLLVVRRVLRPSLGRRARRLLDTGAALWLALILYGTLATKQHWALDLPPGLLLGWLSFRLAWPRSAGA